MQVAAGMVRREAESPPPTHPGPSAGETTSSIMTPTADLISHGTIRSTEADPDGECEVIEDQVSEEIRTRAVDHTAACRSARSDPAAKSDPLASAHRLSD